MPKRSREKEEQRLWNNGEALLRERKRAINENRELQVDLANLRNKYNINFKNTQDHVSWLNSQSIDTQIKFSEDVEGLKTKYKVNDRINNAFWEALWNIPPEHGFYTERILGGMPKLHFSKELGFVLLITPETDIKNELVIEFIETWQKKRLKKQDLPPQPQKIKGSKKRLDWRPVWEWALRHPQITRKEIAQMLHRNYTDVKRKLAELDNELENPPFWYFQK